MEGKMKDQQIEQCLEIDISDGSETSISDSESEVFKKKKINKKQFSKKFSKKEDLNNILHTNNQTKKITKLKINKIEK